MRHLKLSILIIYMYITCVALIFSTIKSYLHCICRLKVAKLVSYIPIHDHFSNIKPTEYTATDLVFKVRDNLFHKLRITNADKFCNTHTCGEWGIFR